MDDRKGLLLFRRLTGLVVMTALLATVFAPATQASQAPPADSPSFSTRSIAKVIAARSPDSPPLKRATARSPKATPKQATASKPFFKTRTGFLVLAVMAVGVGYAAYSAKNDRVHGAGR